MLLYIKNYYYICKKYFMSYREIIKNLEQIKELCEDDCPKMASERITWLITDIKKYTDKLSLWNRLTSSKN